MQKNKCHAIDVSQLCMEDVMFDNKQPFNSIYVYIENKVYNKLKEN